MGGGRKVAGPVSFPVVVAVVLVVAEVVYVAVGWWLLAVGLPLFYT